MAKTERVSFGRVTAWEVDEAVTEKTGIISKLTVSIKEDQIDELIAYLSDENNNGKYGVELEIALFEADEDKSFIASGSLAPKFKKESDSPAPKTKGRSGGRRSL